MPVGWTSDSMTQFRLKVKVQRSGIDTIKYPGYQWECDKLTVGHHKREPRGQPFPSR